MNHSHQLTEKKMSKALKKIVKVPQFRNNQITTTRRAKNRLLNEEETKRCATAYCVT
jgi:hypothetical protein